MATKPAPSELGCSAIAYLEEMGGKELEDFPENWGYVHSDPGGEGTPSDVVKAFAPDGTSAAVCFFEVTDSKWPVAPGEGWGGIAVLHDGFRKPRAFEFGTMQDFDDAVTDSDVRGIFPQEP